MTADGNLCCLVPLFDQDNNDPSKSSTSRLKQSSGRHGPQSNHSKIPKSPGSLGTDALQAAYFQKIQESGEAIKNGDFQKAVNLYTEALAVDPENHILYSNRAAAYIKLQAYNKALKDARKARELDPKWTKVGFCIL